ncbi:hypothetical protein F1C10_05945 [Sphingomonas sp. NBWT7]|uniref:hypothetical protein n=1 Tax=Sphingomonas sp. NBWT7 TaxID=2596913 RepID=UPI0016259F1C|nr:hypothetical protein [Sphingomonas sp. NBWT7]QNE31521.1 hypothetical protein F1C10_05945 [Sphingomonas sp. NBWT7]
MNRAVAIELVHLAAGLMLTLAIFRAGVWAYPQGADSLEPVGWVTMLAIVAMSVPEIAKAARKSRNR